MEFMKLYESGVYTVAELCKLKRVSRACGHKWIRRWREFGEAGLQEQSRAPLWSPNQVAPELVEALLRLKGENPKWGPVTLVDAMVDRDGNRPMAYSTAGQILKRYGLVRPKKRRRHFLSGAGEQPLPVAGPGQTLTADYKGQFRLGNGRYCYALTATDPASRWVFLIEALTSTSIREARPPFERLFREYGVPEQILTDNGSPFCNRRAVGGLTALAKWWIDLGATPVRIDPGKPYQNGIHERMHRTLKDEATQPPEQNHKRQQLAFDRFRYEFNVLRPHRGLGGKPPASAHVGYRLPFPERIQAPEYSSFLEVRRIRSNGEIKWSGDLYFVSEVLIGEDVALEQVTETEWDIWYRHVVLATFDARRRKILRAAKRDLDRDE
jgi:transposase InsO family protein